MTISGMEAQLLQLSERFQRTRDPAIQAEYKALHARWLATRLGLDPPVEPESGEEGAT